MVISSSLEAYKFILLLYRIEHGHQPSVGRPLFPTSEVQVQPDSSPSTRKNCDQETGEAEHELDLPRMQVTRMSKARVSSINHVNRCGTDVFDKHFIFLNCAFYFGHA